MCKGADVSILSRLSKEIYQEDQNENLLYMKEIILRRMKRYTLKGYRGLLMAIRFLSKKELKYFKKKYEKICEMNLEKKKEEYKKFLIELESELVLVGGSAVEDKLQRDLKDTIQSFRNAQMKIWVLTGDKMETAENIAISSGLFNKVIPNLLINRI
jgi:magnesium-transporting ATPase (P-type)